MAGHGLASPQKFEDQQWSYGAFAGLYFVISIGRINPYALPPILVTWSFWIILGINPHCIRQYLRQKIAAHKRLQVILASRIISSCVLLYMIYAAIYLVYQHILLNHGE
jgi:hypothetical protein